jgi:hypothetical protein
VITVRIGEVSQQNYKLYLSLLGIKDSGMIDALWKKGETSEARMGQDELILSINARARSQLPQEQQYLRDENGNIRMLHIELAQRRVKQRDYMNKAVSDALRANGISIADGENYEISVDAGYTVRVSGDNAEKAERIASALNSALVDPNDKMAKSYNTASLSRLLFGHIMNSIHDFPVQVTRTELKKYHIDSALRQWTGLSVNDLNFTDNGIFTPDGREITEVIGKSVAAQYKNAPNEKVFQNEAAATVSYIKDGLTSLQKGGVANIKDVELKITLASNGLLDIGLANGFGVSQRGWYDSLQ